MTRTARSRLNGRSHQTRPGPHHNQRAGSAAPNAQPAPAMQPSFMQRNPLLAGLAAGIAGSYIGNMLFGATESSARTTDAGEPVGEGRQGRRGFQLHRITPHPHAPGSRGVLLFFKSAAVAYSLIFPESHATVH